MLVGISKLGRGHIEFMSGGISRLCQGPCLGYIRGISRLFHQAYLGYVREHVYAKSGEISRLCQEEFPGHVRGHIWAILTGISGICQNGYLVGPQLPLKIKDLPRQDQGYICQGSCLGSVTCISRINQGVISGV